MENTIFRKSTLIFTLIFTIFFAVRAIKPKQAHIELLSSSWLFKTEHNPHSVLSELKTRDVFTAPTDERDGFTLKFIVDLKTFDREQSILEIPWIVNVWLRHYDEQDRRRQNYPAFRMQDGSIPVLEASIALQSLSEKTVKQDMIVGVPLAMLDNPTGKHEVILNFTGICWTMYVDGKLVDNDFPLGYPQWRETNSWKLDPAYVSNAEITLPAIQPVRIKPTTPEISDGIQYWTPRWHNAWVGDVVSFFHKGRYHIFYLFDRRGHESKFGCGGHYFEHISTTDFVNWMEHEAAVPIERQWETIGTGTPFLFEGKLCLSYGLHTTRIYPKEQTALLEQWDYLKKNGGYTGTFSCDTLSAIPAGSTYSISEDGISKFKKTEILFHPCENPSIYTDPEGRLKMLANYGAKGTWESATVEKGWYCTNPDFPLGGDCTFFFRWGKFDYILGGFTKLWSKPANASEVAYTDIVSQGLDFYNGLSVPAITEITGGRFLMAGWLKMRGWGGPLIIHELIQYSDGRIGTKWMSEIIPETGKASILARKLVKTETFSSEKKSYMLTFDVIPSGKFDNKLGVVFIPEEDEQNACEFQICPNDKRAQFGTGLINKYTERERSLKEGGSPQDAYNYAIENLIDVGKPFSVRLIVKSSDKFGGSLIDAEIAGQRTMVSYRPGLTAKKLLFRTDGVELKNIMIAPLKDSVVMNKNLINYL